MQKKQLIMLIIACIVIPLSLFRMCPRENRASRRNALGARKAATQFLAEYLARTYPNAKALIVSNPYIQQADQSRAVIQFEKAGIDGLRKGFGAEITVMGVVFPDLKDGALTAPRSVPGLRPTTTPLSYLVTENAFEDLARAHPECNLLVSLIGLPVGAYLNDFWFKDDSPGIALLLPDLHIIDNHDDIRDAFQSGLITAAVLRKPAAPTDATRPKGSVQEIFERRFLLVTPDNIDEIATTWPFLF